MPLENPEVLYVDSTRELWLQDLTNTSDDSLVSDASVEIQSIEDMEGNEFDGLSYPISMDPVSGTDGAYKATLPYDAGFEAGQHYRAKVFVDAGAGLKGTFWQTLEAKRQSYKGSEQWRNTQAMTLWTLG